MNKNQTMADYVEKDPKADQNETVPLLDKEPEDELQGCGSVAICNPRRRLHRYIVLVFICSLSFGKSLPTNENLSYFT